MDLKSGIIRRAQITLSRLVKFASICIICTKVHDTIFLFSKYAHLL